MRVLMLLLVMTATAQAQGVSFLGLCNKTFDCNAVKTVWSGRSAIITGWLEQSFGRQCSCANRLLRSPKAKVIRVHLINSPCMRNHRCGKGEVLAGESVSSASRKIVQKNGPLFVKFTAVVQRFKQRIANAEKLQCYVSPCLECDLWPSARRVMRNYLSRALPGCSVVDNPNHGRCIKGTVCEKHGNHPKLSAPCIADLDGTDGKGVDLKAYQLKTRTCDIRFYWTPQYNCTSIYAPFTIPSRRVCRFTKKDAVQTRRRSCQL